MAHEIAALKLYNSKVSIFSLQRRKETVKNDSNTENGSVVIYSVIAYLFHTARAVDNGRETQMNYL
jgi:hypothetical protein